MICANRRLSSRKAELLEYFRHRAGESLERIKSTYASREFKEKASAINRAIIEMRQEVIDRLLQRAAKEKWSNQEILRCVLMITYTNYIVMIEHRNDVWPYEYMTFSRRIGELWQPFCKLCFDFPLRNLTPYVPPLFSQAKQMLVAEFENHIHALSITEQQKKDLYECYNRVWAFVTSGEIRLELDLHFEQDGEKFVVDFKSGFGSNEKGNTNRLLLVASIYKNMQDNYRCLLLVRAEEDRNNNYFRTLKNSGMWEAYCGDETYEKISLHSGFDISQWIKNNIEWSSDFRSDVMLHFKENNLDQYLKW